MKIKRLLKIYDERHTANFFSNELLIHDKQPLELWHTIQQSLLSIIRTRDRCAEIRDMRFNGSLRALGACRVSSSLAIPTICLLIHYKVYLK